MHQQTEWSFWGSPNLSGEIKPPPTEKEKLWAVNYKENEKCPLHRFVGNEPAKKKLAAAIYTALGKKNHVMRELAFSIFGPSSAGKTTLARMYADAVRLPFIEISPKSIAKCDDLLKVAARVLAEVKLPLVEETPKHYRMPPCVVFIDEVHALPNSVIDGLLKATEPKDSILVTESGCVVSTWKVTWIIATTDEGKLFEAFRTRFSPIVLKLLNKEQVAQIIKNEMPQLPFEVCKLVAHYNSRVPRKALEFARYMQMVKGMQPDSSWQEIAREVATDEGIDRYGMHEVHLKILKALGQGPIAKNRLPLVAGRKDEECDRFIMPWLLTETDDQAAFVHVTTKGYCLTDAGVSELVKRGIDYKEDCIQ